MPVMLKHWNDDKMAALDAKVDGLDGKVKGLDRRMERASTGSIPSFVNCGRT
jgi:hypothetical protein